MGDSGAHSHGCRIDIRSFVGTVAEGSVWVRAMFRECWGGCKNWLFAETVGGAKASANLYSLIETARANGIEPWAYLW